MHHPSPSGARRPSAPALLLFASFGFAVLHPEPAAAWPAEAYRYMVYDVLRMLPPSLGRVLLRRDETVLRGAASLEGETASLLARDGRRGTVSDELVNEVERRIERIVESISEHRPFSEISAEMGKLLRIAADLSDPVVMGSGRPELRRIAGEYIRFTEMHLTEFPLVHDEGLPSPLDGTDVSLLLAEVASATNASVEPLARAFWNEGAIVPASAFDFRSVPFAKTSLGYSRAVTAASYLWLAAWSRANGDFTGYRFSGGERR